MKNKTTAWTPEEDAALAAAVRDKISPARLTVRLQRSEAGIKRRMRELGLIGKRKLDVTPNAIEPAILVKWFLQAARTGDLGRLMSLYHPDATLECTCSGGAVFAGSGAIQEYWALKVGSKIPNAFSLVSFRAENGEISLDYFSYEGKPVRMHLSTDRTGKISRSDCGPRGCTTLAA